MNLTNEDISNVTFNIKKNVLKRLKINAVENDTNVTEILNKLIRDYLERKK